MISVYIFLFLDQLDIDPGLVNPADRFLLDADDFFESEKEEWIENLEKGIFLNIMTTNPISFARCIASFIIFYRH